MTKTDHNLYASALSEFPFTQATRRDLHQHPELGFQEVRTAGIVAKELTALNMEVVTGLAKTGVVGLLQGSQPGPTVMVRFDMDALPIQEETGAIYASQNPGKMHACGHDGHTAIGLTAARLLAQRKDEIIGNVQFVFQPSEEGNGGAREMIKAGALTVGPKPDYCLGLHVWNEKPVGWVSASPGPIMAGAEIFNLRVTGKGGHGAQPHQSIDPMVAVAQWVTAIQSIVSRNVSPLQSAVISITSIHGGDAFNVIPQNVTAQGTIRTFDPKIRETVLSRFETITRGILDSMGCKVELQVNQITPAVINNSEVTAVVQESIRTIFPDHQLITSGYQTMGSEDMAEFMNAVPGCFILIGSANPEKGLDAGHHHPRFDFDEEVLPQGAAIISNAVFHLLTKKS